MSDETVPNYSAMMQAVLDALRTSAGQASNAEINAAVVQALALPAAVVERLHKEGSALTEVGYRLQWTRTYLRQFGLIDSPRRGHWALTELGWKTETVDPAEVVRTVQGQMEAKSAAKDGQAPIFPDLVAEAPARPPATTVAAGVRSPTPLFPTYGNVRHFLHILDGVPAAAYLSMANAIMGSAR